MNFYGNGLYRRTTAFGCCLSLACLLCSCAVGHTDTLLATNLWKFWFSDVLHSDNNLSTPAIGADGTIYLGSFDGKLHALSPEGTEKWYFKAGLEIKSSPAIGDDGTIYFGSRDHQFYAINSAGRLKWKYSTGAWVDSSAAIAADGTIYFGSWDKNFYALNADGSLKWKFATDGIVDSSPAIGADGTIYFGSHDKRFYALDTTGKPRWNFLTGAQITSSPAIGDDGTIYFSSTDGNLYRLKPDGTDVWHCRIGGGGDSSPVLADNGDIVIGAAYHTMFVSPEGKVLLDLGSPCWIDATPAAARGMVLSSAPWRSLSARSADGTNLLWEAHADDNLSSSPVFNQNGDIYICCERHLEAIQAPVPLLSAKSSWPMFRANVRHTGRVGGS